MKTSGIGSSTQLGEDVHWYRGNGAGAPVLSVLPTVALHLLRLWRQLDSSGMWKLAYDIKGTLALEGMAIPAMSLDLTIC